MNINDVLHFSPDIPFKDVDWKGDRLPGQFRQRIEGFYLEPAECCIRAEHAFAAGLLLVGCIDALARLKYRSTAVGDRFKRLLKETKRIPASTHQRFCDEIRNGLVHEARLKNGAQFTLDSTVNEIVTERADVLLVNPEPLLTEVRTMLDSYISVLEKDEHERRLLSASLMLDLEKDILAAERYGS
jgi:hypothetical protein